MHNDKARGRVTGVRRFVRALMVTGFALLLSGGVLGLASAGDSRFASHDFPDSLTIPPPLVGDRFEFVRETVVGDPSDLRSSNESYPLRYIAEWLDARAIRDADGRVRMVNPLAIHVEVPRHLKAPGYNLNVTTVYGFEPGTDNLLTRITYQNDSERDGLQYGSDSRSTSFFHDEEVRSQARPCVAMMGGRTLELEYRRPWRLGECTLSFTVFQPVDLRPIGVEYLGGERTVVFYGTFSEGYHGSLRVWMSENYSVPVRALLGYEWDDSKWELFRLAGFDRGTEPLLASDVPGPPLEPLRLSPTKPWGPDDEGVVHPFPLRDAFAYARDDPSNSSLRDFLRAHPTASTVWADYRSFVFSADGRVDRQWIFVLSDGTAEHGVCLHRQDRQPPGATGLVALPPSMHYSKCTHYEDSVYQYRDDIIRCGVPQMMPSVGAMFERWRLYATAPHSSETPNRWLFSPATSVDCSSRMAISAGYTGPGSRPVDPLNSFSQNRLTSSSILLDETGRIDAVSEFTAGRPEDVIDTPTQMDLGNTTILSSFEAPVWAFPLGPYAFMAFLVSIGAGALYWFWPSVKAALATGLFSRIDAPRALAHPARGSLMEAIRADPGVHMNELARRVGMPLGTLRHHVDKLVATGLVKRRDGAKFSSLFPADVVDRRILAVGPFLRTEAARRILAAIEAAPGISMTEVGRRVGIARQSVHETVHRLAGAGVVRLEKRGRAMGLFSERPTGAAG